MLDINRVLNHADQGKHLYVCGPNGFMDFVTKSAVQNGWSERNIHLERFGAELDTDGAPFTVVAAQSGKQVIIEPGETIAEKLAGIGIKIPVFMPIWCLWHLSLRQSLKGMPDHRDLVLTDQEKAANDQITVCCSRSKSKQLILDV